MSLGEEQIFAQKKDTFKHNTNSKNQKQYQEQYVCWNFKKKQEKFNDR